VVPVFTAVRHFAHPGFPRLGPFRYPVSYILDVCRKGWRSQVRQFFRGDKPASVETSIRSPEK
jgi:hypothetical protein